ncbi:hypothetical protein PV08_09350 [Exophiala spinifera]|uniref:ASX DEUBAD domain-containing protein n=1 Tax=Exophiala spinifera TaxID=91928 RepID=A0A0D1YAZ3_9EURO|nr:uncharacterized protein PV08_09350 [Exophiala spinifera]KIW12076.1 hypothetical protein PV08_09350 [Exophiala spinifera]
MPPKKSNPKSKKSKSKSTTVSIPPGAPKSGPWSTSRILNSSSPITDKDIHSFLVRAVSDWSTSYTEDEKRALIDALPPRLRVHDIDASSGTLVCPITPDFVLGDQHVKAAVPKFKQHVADGFYEKGWQNRARAAMRERREGRFDAYLQEQVEASFGGQTEGVDPVGGGGGGADGTMGDGARASASASSDDGEWKGR